MTRFDVLYGLSLPLLAPYLLWRRVKRGKYAESARGMLGRELPRGADAQHLAPGSIWLHAVSVGEIAAAQAVAPGLRALRPELPLVVSTITETGQAAAHRAFPGDTMTYFPIDYSANVRRFQQVFDPRIFVLLETELWPNFLTLAAARGTRCFMINGRLSDRSFPRYRRFAGLLRPALDALSGVCVQTPLDAERFAALGIPAARIRVTGNCKFDLAQEPLDAGARAALFAEFGMNPARRWIVAGSTHPGEESAILEAFEEIRRAIPEAGLLLAPRHPDRFREVRRLVGATGLRVGLAEADDGVGAQAIPEADAGGGEDLGPEIVVLNKMGVLAQAYGLGEVAIVAGSFCAVGGHNLLEAAAHGIPVIFGPQMHSQREMHRLFTEARAGLQVEAYVLGATITALLRDDAQRRAEGERARAVVQSNQGNAARAIDALREWLG